MNIANALKIEGWMTETELKFLAETAEKSILIVEFGCYKGRSTRALADNTHGRVIAVDPWDKFYPDNDGNKHSIDPDVYDDFRANLYDKISDCTVIPMRMRSTEFYMAAIPDFVFIDGDHRYETVKKDIQLGLDLIKKGGVLAGHDYTHGDWPGVRLAVDEMFPIVNLIGSIWWVNV